MNFSFYAKATDIDDAMNGVEMALSGIQLAIDELESTANIMNYKEMLSAPINVLYLSKQRISDEYDAVRRISDEMYAVAKEVKS